MSYKFEKHTHQSKGKAGRKAHSVGASPHSGARKNKIRKALEAREDKVQRATGAELLGKVRGFLPAPAVADMVQKAAKQASKAASEQDTKKGAKKKTKKIPTVTAPKGSTKRRPTKEEILQDQGYYIDYEQLSRLKGGGKVKGYKHGGFLGDAFVASGYDKKPMK